MEWTIIIKQFIGLFAVIDPIGGVVFFIGLAGSRPIEERAKIAMGAVLTMGITLIVAVLLGDKLLWFFGISLFSFRVGGGILILLTSIAMLGGYAPSLRRTPQELLESEDKASVAVVPLGIPFLAGPGAITTAVISAQNAKLTADLGILIGIIVLIAAITFVIFLSSGPISKVLGKTGMNIFTRLLGLLLAAISIEIIANGLKGLFPVLGH
jgi:multiple antibiotic resistance protein